MPLPSTSFDHWLQHAQKPLEAGHVPVSVLGYGGIISTATYEKIQAEPELRRMMHTAQEMPLHGLEANLWLDMLRKKFVRHGIIEDKPIEHVLLANLWSDPQVRDEKSISIDLTLCKALGLPSDKIGCIMTQGQNVILAVRADKKYGAELDVTAGGNKEWQQDWRTNLLRETAEETLLDLSSHMERVTHHGAFLSQRPAKSGVTRGRHAVVTLELPHDVKPKTTPENLAYVYAPRAALEAHLRNPEAGELLPHMMHLPAELRTERMKFNLPASLIIAGAQLFGPHFNDTTSPNMQSAVQKLRGGPGFVFPGITMPAHRPGGDTPPVVHRANFL